MFVLGPGLINLYLALGLLGWASTARLIRGDVMRLKKMEYIDACKVSGGNSFRIIMKHLLPNCSATYYSVIPGLAIIITVLAFNMLGDGLRDALDPKLRS